MNPDEVKHCEVCGRRMFRRGKPAAVFAQRRFCSKACSGKAQRATTAARLATQTKTCVECGQEFSRRRGMSQSAWEAQKCCGHICRMEYVRGSRRGTYEPRDRDDICYCGQPATTTIYFEQGNAFGTFAAGSLAVCATCRALALESDPTVRLEPVRSRFPERVWPPDEADFGYTPRTGGFARGRSYHD